MLIKDTIEYNNNILSNIYNGVDINKGIPFKNTFKSIEELLEEKDEDIKYIKLFNTIKFEELITNCHISIRYNLYNTDDLTQEQIEDLIIDEFNKIYKNLNTILEVISKNEKNNNNISILTNKFKTEQSKTNAINNYKINCLNKIIVDKIRTNISNNVRKIMLNKLFNKQEELLEDIKVDEEELDKALEKFNKNINEFQFQKKYNELDRKILDLILVENEKRFYNNKINYYKTLINNTSDIIRLSKMEYKKHKDIVNSYKEKYNIIEDENFKLTQKVKEYNTSVKVKSKNIKLEKVIQCREAMNNLLSKINYYIGYKQQLINTLREVERIDTILDTKVLKEKDLAKYSEKMIGKTITQQAINKKKLKLKEELYNYFK